MFLALAQSLVFSAAMLTAQVEACLADLAPSQPAAISLPVLA